MRFPSKTNKSSNNAAASQQQGNRPKSPFRATQQRILGRHVSPFRPSRASTTEQTSTNTRRSKTPGRVRWFQNASTAAGVTIKKKVPPKSDTTAPAPDLTQTKTVDTVESESSSLQQQQSESSHFNVVFKENSTEESTTAPPSTPTRTRGDPEEVISLDSTPARSNRSTTTRPPPLLATTDTIELTVPASPARTVATSSIVLATGTAPINDASSVSTAPPDPEGLELWTTPTKQRRAAPTFDDSDSSGSCGSDDDEHSRLLLFGDDDEDDEDTLHTDTAASNGFFSADGAATQRSAESNTAEEAARGACADLTAPRDVMDDHDRVDTEKIQQQLQQYRNDNDVVPDTNNGGGGDDDYDDYTWTASLAPSAGFESLVSPSFYSGRDPSIVERQRRLWSIRDGDGDSRENEATSPPKEVLAMKADGGDGVAEGDNSKTSNVTRHLADDDDISNKDENLRMAREMAANLLQELETARGENERLMSRNRRLVTNMHELKSHQEDNMIHRSRLVKACLYVSPVFILCGGLDIFCITILLVWVLVEVESYMDLGDEKAAPKLSGGDSVAGTVDKDTACM